MPRHNADSAHTTENRQRTNGSLFLQDPPCKEPIIADRGRNLVELSTYNINTEDILPLYVIRREVLENPKVYFCNPTPPQQSHVAISRLVTTLMCYRHGARVRSSVHVKKIYWRISDLTSKQIHTKIPKTITLFRYPLSDGV